MLAFDARRARRALGESNAFSRLFMHGLFFRVQSDVRIADRSRSASPCDDNHNPSSLTPSTGVVRRYSVPTLCLMDCALLIGALFVKTVDLPDPLGCASLVVV